MNTRKLTSGIVNTRKNSEQWYSFILKNFYQPVNKPIWCHHTL